jgi:hypothetical protein
MIGLGLALLLSGLSNPDAVSMVVGASDIVLGICFILLEPVAEYSLGRLLGSAERAERAQMEDPDQ